MFLRGFHKLADLSPISLETEDKILNGKCTPSGATPKAQTWWETAGCEQRCLFPGQTAQAGGGAAPQITAAPGGELPQNMFRPAGWCLCRRGPGMSFQPRPPHSLSSELAAGIWNTKQAEG